MKATMTRDEVLDMLAGVAGSKRFVMFIGLPGSGKSNLAKALVKRGVERLSTDRLQKRNPVLGLQPFLLLGHFYDVLKDGLRQGKRIADDNPNLSARGRQKVLKLAAAAGYEIILVHMDTPLAICLERNSGRSRVVSDSTIKELSRSFIPAGLPRPSEGRIVRISSTRVDEATFEVET